MKTLIMAVCLLTSTAMFGQQGLFLTPDVKAKPDQMDTLTYVVIVYETPKSILKDVVMENEYLRSYVADKSGVEIVYRLTYKGPATVNDKYKEHIEVLELSIITH